MEPQEFSKMECLKVFRTPNQVCLQVKFDPSSRFLAAGTTDSHIKIFDVVHGYQTHNFLGHRGIILQLQFHPQEDSLKLVSTAEDFVIRVWDLVLKKEVAAMKPKGSDNKAAMTMSMLFTNDRKTFITAGRDGHIHFWDAMNNFKLISAVAIESLGAIKFEEINCMTYIAKPKEDPCLVFGGLSGQICVYSIKRQQIVFRADESRYLCSAKDGTKLNEIDADDKTNEIVFMEYLK